MHLPRGWVGDRDEGRRGIGMGPGCGRYGLAVRLSPALAATGTYPFVHLERAKRRLAAEGVELIDFGKGDPMEPTDPLIRQALVDGLEERMGYPLAEGLPALRHAAAGWVGRRFGVELDPDTELIPTLRREGGDLHPRAARRRSGAARRTSCSTRSPRTRSTNAARCSPGRSPSRSRCARRTAFFPTSQRSTRTCSGARASCGSTTRTTRPPASPRSISSSARPLSRPSTTSCSPPTRRTPSSGSTSPPTPRWRPPTDRTSPCSRRCRSGRR